MTRTERVLVAFRLMLEGAAVSASSLAAATGAPVKTCSSDLTVLRRAVALEQVNAGPHASWGLPGRAPPSKGQRAYELREQGLSWPEVRERTGYRTVAGAMLMARRYAEAAGLPWPTAVRRAGSVR